MTAIEQVTSAVDKLTQRGQEILSAHKEKDGLVKLRLEYEPWYTQSLSFLSQVVPERLDDFRNAYKGERRKEITYETYGVSDYLIGLSITWAGSPVFDPLQAFQMKLLAQIGILRAAAESAPSVLRDVRTVLRAELFDRDVDAAKELLRKKHLRSAGVICGVVLEGHMKSVAERRTIKLTKKNLTIADLNDALKGAAVYDVPLWRSIQRLADIRNLCCHAGERAPTCEEVEDLIAGTEKVIKDVW